MKVRVGDSGKLRLVLTTKGDSASLQELDGYACASSKMSMRAHGPQTVWGYCRLLLLFRLWSRLNGNLNRHYELRAVQHLLVLTTRRRPIDFPLTAIRFQAEFL
ncbi:MAG: hypothetical protein ACI841_004973 [Planctomycetota bacterium]|jgi:hypothetical protein